MRLCACIFAVVVLASPASAGPLDDASRYLIGQRAPSGGFAEPGASVNPGLTGWAVLGLVAADHCPTRSGDYLRGKPYPTATDLELRILALDALRERCTFDVNLSGQVSQLIDLRKPSGRIGATVNSTIWGVLALRAVGPPGWRQDDLLPPRAAKARRRLALVPGWESRLERHCGRDSGASSRGGLQGCTVDSARARLSALAAKRQRWLRADQRPRFGHPVDRVGGAGLHRGEAAPRTRGHSVPPQHAADERKLPVQPAVRDDTGVGDLAGAGCARPRAVSAPLALSGRLTG